MKTMYVVVVNNIPMENCSAVSLSSNRLSCNKQNGNDFAGQWLR